VDPGRVNLVTITALLHGKPLLVERGARGRSKALKFRLTSRHYYAASGIKVATARRLAARRREPSLRKLDAALQGTTLRTADPTRVLQHLLDFNQRREAAWKFATSRSAAKTKLRLKIGKRRALDRFFAMVRRRLRTVVGKEVEESAMFVWGSAKISPSGRGNLTVPTSSTFVQASRHWPGRIVLGSEFRTSQVCSRDGCYANLAEARVAAPRALRLRVVVDEPGRRASWRARQGFLGWNHKRALRRGGRPATGRVQVKLKRDWRLDGHGGEDAATKAEKKRLREAQGEEAKYVRGLRFCQGCQKLHDRDEVACFGIGVIWTHERLRKAVPDAYSRATPRVGRRAR